MCWCDPRKRTPFCGKPGCHPPGKPQVTSMASADPFANPPLAVEERDFDFDTSKPHFDGWTDVNHYHHKQVVKENHWHSFGDGDVINHNHAGPVQHSHRLVLATPDDATAPRHLTSRESSAIIRREEREMFAAHRARQGR